MQRKRRTPEHVLADLAANDFERVVLECGWAVERTRTDSGIDARVWTFTPAGEIESGIVHVQLKARRRLGPARGGGFPLDLDARDAAHWMGYIEPVIVVLYDGATRRGYWLHVQRSAPLRALRPGARTVRVRVPRSQLVTRGAIRLFGRLKRQAYDLARDPEGWTDDRRRLVPEGG